MKMSKKGFTLIELLVVIAIIAILAAILFPVFISAKEKGRQASCLNNEKQCASALLMYAGDNGDRLPGIWYDDARQLWRAPFSWLTMSASLVNPYMKNLNAQLCPSMPKMHWTNASGTVFPPAPSYAMNQAVCGVSAAAWYSSNPRLLSTQKPPVLGNVVNPSRTIMMMDMYPFYAYIWSSAHTEVTREHRWLNTNTTTYQGAPSSASYGKVTGVDSAMHSGGTNFAFVDGHVSWFRVHTKEIDTDEWWDLK